MVRIHPDPPTNTGGVAQLGERLLCKQEVIGSIPFTSTTLKGSRQKDEEGDRRLIQIPERSQVSPEAYFWSFDRRGCSLFNNSEEASASISRSGGGESDTGVAPSVEGKRWWAFLDSNQRPLPYQGSALTS